MRKIIDFFKTLFNKKEMTAEEEREVIIKIIEKIRKCQ